MVVLLLEMGNGTGEEGAEGASESEMEKVERSRWVRSWADFTESIGKSITELPMGSKRPIDLFKLYFQVRAFGGLVNVFPQITW